MSNDITFKGEYAELQKNIAPDAEFLERLARTMELQQQQRDKKQLRKKRTLFLVPALTTVCAGAAALTIFLNLPKRTRPEPLPVNTATDVNFAYATGVFENETSLSGGDALPRQLSEMISDSKTTLYKSDTNKFDYEDKLDDAARKALAEKIKAARKTNSEAGKNGDYYMMTLENGDVFKFRVSKNILVVENNFYKIM